MVSLPDNAVVARALDNLDPLVVIDFFLSETAERADVVLPGSVWCEDEGTTTNLEGPRHQDQRGRRPARRGAPRLGDPVRAGARGWGAASSSRTRARREIWDELRRRLARRRVRLLRHHLGEDRRAGWRLLALPDRGPSRHAAPVHRALRAPGRQGEAVRRSATSRRPRSRATTSRSA